MKFLRHAWRQGQRISSAAAAAQTHKRASVTGGTAAVVTMAAYAVSVTPNPTSSSSSSAEGEKAAAAAEEPKSHHVKNWRGTTVRFRNPHVEDEPSMTGWTAMVRGLKMLVGLIDWPLPTPADAFVPVVRPEFLATRTSASPSHRKLRATWLGHACYYVEYPSGLRVLFDPVFEECCAPVRFARARRYTPPPCGLGDLPFVDAVVISHSHYDHLSHPSVLEVRRHHPDAHFFVGQGLAAWFRASGVANVTELDWWESADLVLTPRGKAEEESGSGSESSRHDGDGAGSDDNNNNNNNTIRATFTCLPSQHTSARSGFDKDKTLWASWAVTSGDASQPQQQPPRTVWFGGDTGYRTSISAEEGATGAAPASAPLDELPRNPQFRRIGERLGRVDLGLIPIGAYDPRFLFWAVHANPADAVEIFRDVRCRRAMAIHWGTWSLTTEHPLEPPRRLREALRRRGIPETGVFDVCDVGETREFGEDVD
ncbi:Metallo-hydrolase/oxidoreductase [Xylariomycetidae sp. FL0641]|nr:Metallo-hydrolase/oxidoreductase [Xylariomycetidae sp. FL0641]